MNAPPDLVELLPGRRAGCRALRDDGQGDPLETSLRESEIPCDGFKLMQLGGLFLEVYVLS